MELSLAIELFLAFIIAGACSLISGPLFIGLAHKLNFLDYPNSNLKNHGKPVAYLGGLVVYVGMIMTLLVMSASGSISAYFILGSTFLLLVGLTDDCISLKPYQKMLGQIVATSIFVTGGLHLKETFLSSYNHPWAYRFWVGISAFWTLSVINAFNLVDVMDGLACTIALMACGAFFVISLLTHTYTASLILAAFAGALTGFLWYNRPPARIYLGDAGSLFIGGVIGSLPFMIPWGTFSPFGFFAPVIILAIPLLEVGTLIIIRTAKGIPFYQGSPHHFSHYLRAKSWQPSQILAYTTATSLMLFGIVMLYLSGLLELQYVVISQLLFACLWYFILFF